MLIFENIDQVVIENNTKPNKEFKINKKIEVDELVSMLDSKSETKQTFVYFINDNFDIEEKLTSNNENGSFKNLYYLFFLHYLNFHVQKIQNTHHIHI